MEALGARLARVGLQTGVIGLEGELGTGKTTLVRGWLRALGVKGPVRSPTFTLIEPYEVSQGQVYHFDLYRLSNPEELEYLGARDYFVTGSLCLIEWPERGKGWLPPVDLTIKIEFSDRGQGRRVSLVSHSAVAERLISSLSEKPR
jgi:tRNA threonylcarbamoyladenosine biosynthesis protein TsaE